MKNLVLGLIGIFCWVTVNTPSGMALTLSNAVAANVLEYKGTNYTFDAQRFNQALAKNDMTARDIEVIQVSGSRWVNDNALLGNHAVWEVSYNPIRRSDGRNGNGDNVYNTRDRLRRTCIAKGDRFHNECLTIVGTGGAVGGALSAACGPLVGACILVVGIASTAGAYVCNDALVDYKEECNRVYG